MQILSGSERKNVMWHILRRNYLKEMDNTAENAYLGEV
jgi:hypothetical protein